MPRLRNTFVITMALICLILPACLPFLQANLPRSDDGHLHLYRIIALDDTWTRDGHLYPRYASNLVYGYGAPLFNYFPPVAYMPGALLHRLGLSYVQAFQATMIGALLVAALGMYTLASSTWPNEARYRVYAGFGAAALYVYSPYLLFDAVGRGTLTEVVALSVLPWVLWAMIRLAAITHETRTRAWYAMPLRMWLFIGLLALFIPLHNVVTLHGALLLAVVGLALIWQRPTLMSRLRLMLLFVMAGVVALLMSLFFLAPALLEGDAVKIRAVTDALSFIDVTRTLRPLTDLMVPFYTADPTNLQPPTPIVYSWIALFFAVGAVWSMRRSKVARPLILALLLILILTILLMWDTSLGVWLWHTIPLLDYTQFAWRVLGIGSLALAWLGGWGFAFAMQSTIFDAETRPSLPPGRFRAPVFLVWMILLGFIISYGLPWTIVRHEPLPADSILDAQQHERTSRELALSSYSEYLPTAVETPPEPERLREAFASNQPVPRLQENASITVQSAEWGGTRGLLTFEAAEPTKLVFDWLYVPGWEARLFGSEGLACQAPTDCNDTNLSLPTSVKPAAPHGLVSVEVPAGAYTLEIAWHETPLERTSSLISIAVWLIWGVMGLGIVFVGAQRAVSPTAYETEDRAQHAAPLQRSIFVSTIIGGLGMTLLAALIVNRQVDGFWVSERYASSAKPPAATFADQILLREYTLGMRSLRAGEDLPITLYWQAGQVPTRNESSLIELRDANGNVLARGGSFQPGGLAMTHWQPGTYVIENAQLAIPADVPPGNYTITLGLYDPVSQAQRSVLNEAGNPQDVKFTLGSITVMRPAQPLAVDDSTPMINGIAFAGISTLLPVEAAPGQEFTFDPTWVLLNATDPNTQMQLGWKLVDGDAGDARCGFGPYDKQQACTELSPLVATYPLDQWRVGDVWRGVSQIFVPGNLETGNYHVWVGLDAPVPGRVNAFGSIDLGIMHITAPERTDHVPDDMTAQFVSWANGLALQGYTGTIDDFTLYWQTMQPIQANLRLSVQIIDANEQIIAQQDGVPVDWTRPVAGWAVDEVIATHYVFDVPDGEYRVRLVWYDAATGERVMMEEGGDSTVIEVK